MSRALLAALLLATPAPAWIELPAPLARDPRRVAVPALKFEPPSPKRARLSNGVEVYLAEDHSAPLVSLSVMVRSGSVDEAPDKLGVASLTAASLRAGGAGERSADALDETLDRLAIDLGVSSGAEYTLASVSARSEQRAEAFGLLADVLLRPRFEAARVELSRQRTLEGIRRRGDSPGGEAWRALGKRVYGKDSVWAREATAATVVALKPDDLRRFHAQTYSAQGARLLLSGDFDEKQALAELESRFGGWKAAPLPARDFPKVPRTLARQVVVIPRSVAQAKIRIGTFGFTRHDQDEFALRLADAVLGSSAGPNRLKLAVREERGLAYSVGSSLSPGTDVGLFAVSADTKPESAGEVIEQVLAQLEALEKQPPSADELSRAKDGYINGFAFRFDTPAKVVSEWAQYDFFGYPADYLTHFRERVASVEAASTSRAFARVVRPETLQIVVVGDPAKLGDLSRFGPVLTVRDVERME